MAALLLSLVAVVPIISMVNPAEADAARRVVLGKANMRELDPNCGKSNPGAECTAEGKITGYQALSRENPGRNFVVPFEGKVVSWSIELANPTKRDTETSLGEVPFFNSLFGTPAQARISVLKRVEKRKKGPPRYKMVRQSPVQILNPYFGTTVQFALSKPLNVIRNQIVALTIPTWAPATWKPASCNDSEFKLPACEKAEKDYTWRGSRAPDKCSIGFDLATREPNEALAKSHPQQKVGSVKRYGCYYGANVLLYSATIIEKP